MSAPGWVGLVGTFIVERYLAGWPPDAVASLVHRVERASDRLASYRVTHLDSIVIPEDEMCLCLFDAPTVDAVKQANAALGLPVDRVVVANITHGSSAHR
jgi:Nickel responsive protein SCO4226-like